MHVTDSVGEKVITQAIDALVLYTAYISLGVYFREFCESGAIREFNNTLKYLPRFRCMNATCVRNTLVVQCTSKAGSLILPSENE